MAYERDGLGIRYPKLDKIPKHQSRNLTIPRLNPVVQGRAVTVDLARGALPYRETV
jgi:hypothetical protein